MIVNKIFEKMEREKCRQITFHIDPKTGMKVIFVVDSIPNERDNNGKLNISVSGGTRFAHSNADDALEDCIKLARAMTRKANVLNVKEGGAKAVVIADKKKTKEFLESIGDFIQIHKGLFKTAIDLGFNLKDAEIIASKTDFVDSLSHVCKGLGSTGENTAEGLIQGFNIICKEILKKQLEKCSISVQGLGAVGMALARRLIKRRCKVVATDTDKKLCKQAERLDVRIVKPDNIFEQEVDIFAPCAFGGVINKETILKLRCKVIAGGANNQLENEKDEKQLLERRIIFIPDFVINCGGFLQALVERKGGTIKEAREKSNVVVKRLTEVIKFSKQNNCTLLESAIKLFGDK